MISIGLPYIEKKMINAECAVSSALKKQMRKRLYGWKHRMNIMNTCVQSGVITF